MIHPSQNYPLLLKFSERRPFKSIMGKGENAGYHKFSIFSFFLIILFFESALFSVMLDMDKCAILLAGETFIVNSPWLLS